MRPCIGPLCVFLAWSTGHSSVIQCFSHSNIEIAVTLSQHLKSLIFVIHVVAHAKHVIANRYLQRPVDPQDLGLVYCTE